MKWHSNTRLCNKSTLDRGHTQQMQKYFSNTSIPDQNLNLIIENLIISMNKRKKRKIEKCQSCMFTASYQYYIIIQTIKWNQGRKISRGNNINHSDGTAYSYLTSRRCLGQHFTETHSVLSFHFRSLLLISDINMAVKTRQTLWSACGLHIA